MTAKEYLSQFRDHYRWKKKTIESKQREIKHLEAMAEYSSPKWMGGSNNSKSDRVGGVAAKIADENNKLQQQIEELLELRRKIEAQIDQLDDERHHVVLWEIYVNGSKIEDVAEITHYVARTVEYLHHDALVAFEQKFPFIKSL